MFASMSLDNLVKKPVHGTARRSDQMKYLLAIRFRLHRTLNGSYLACNTPYPLKQLIFVLR